MIKTVTGRNQLHKYLIEVAAKSPCNKRKVGAVMAREIFEGEIDYEILAEGYNFNPDGGSCETGEGETKDEVIHAEVACVNNFQDTLNTGAETPAGTTLFVTHPPCDGCKATLLRHKIPYEVMGDFMKFDSDKPRLSLVPGSLVEAVGRVVTYGAKKYKVDNWKKVPSQERYWDALERHLIAFKNGEVKDEESGLDHIDHIACNAAFLIELKKLPLRDEE